MNDVSQLTRRTFVMSAAAFGGGLAFGLDLPFGPRTAHAAESAR